MCPNSTCLPILVQTSLSHTTLDGLRRITVAYPAIIDADWLLNQLAIQHERSNIEINSITGAVWKINLGRCYELLSRLPWQPGARRLELDDLVHNRRMPLAGWLDCMVPGKEGEFVSSKRPAVASSVTYSCYRSNSSNTPICQTRMLIRSSP